MTKRDALRVAFTELGCWDVPAALRWLSDRGVTADHSDARRIAKAQQSERAQLVPITGGAR